MIDRKIRGGFYYSNQIWQSPAYQSLTIASRNLLQCFVSELRWTGKGKKRTITNNGHISFCESEFKKLYNCCSSTYLKARNKLIDVGFIKQTYRGGMCRGDRAKYRLLIGDALFQIDERWRRYPDEDWAHEIPKAKKQLVGVKTQWKKGESGRKAKATLKEYTLSNPKGVDPNDI